MGGELVVRSFTKHEKKRLSWAFVGCFAMALSFFALLNSYMGPLSLLDFQISNLTLKEFWIIDMSNDPIDNGATTFSARNASQPPPGMCNFSLPRSDFCEINGDARILGNSSAIYISPSLLNNAEKSNKVTWKLRPYARKVDSFVMKKGRELQLGSPSSFGLDSMPKCSINHTVPAIVFSAGGYVGNIFHEFSDVLVPLYLTSKAFNGSVQLLVTSLKCETSLIKYKTLLDSLSNYPIIDMDKSNEVHCFKSMIVGLKNHIDFGIDPSKTPQGYSMRSFTQFVRSAYSLKRSKVKPLRDHMMRKPRLLILSRKSTRRRAILNEDEVAAEAKSLGYEVALMEASRNVEDFSRKVNSFDVMVAVHGAGLTNMVFLPENAVLIQVVPLGLDWSSRTYYEMPAKSMNLRYLEYKVVRKESTLGDEHFIENSVIGNSTLLKPVQWPEFKKYYLDGQSVKIDVKRFRPTLLKALDLLR